MQCLRHYSLINQCKNKATIGCYCQGCYDEFKNKETTQDKIKEVKAERHYGADCAEAEFGNTI